MTPRGVWSTRPPISATRWAAHGEEIEYTADDKLLGRFVYRYDSNGRLLKIDAYDAEGNLVDTGGATSQSKHSLPGGTGRSKSLGPNLVR